MWHWPFSPEVRNQISNFLLNISTWVPNKYFTLNKIKTKFVTSVLRSTCSTSGLLHINERHHHLPSPRAYRHSQTIKKSNVPLSKMYFRSVLYPLSLHYTLVQASVASQQKNYTSHLHGHPASSLALYKHLPHRTQKSFYRSIPCPFSLHQNKSKFYLQPLHFTDKKK